MMADLVDRHSRESERDPQNPPMYAVEFPSGRIHHYENVIIKEGGLLKCWYDTEDGRTWTCFAPGEFRAFEPAWPEDEEVTADG